MYTGETPWHGLGKRLENVATSEEALKASGLDWEVVANPVYTKIDNTMIEIPDKYSISRNTDHKIYNFVSGIYKIVQPRECFKFFDDVVGEKLAIYHTAGSLKGGAVIWILAKLPGELMVKNEEIDKFLLLSTSYDSSRAHQMCYTPQRVVCWNTLKMADASASSKFYMKHTTNINLKLEQAKMTLGIANKFFQNWKLQADKLAGLMLPEPERPLLLKAAFLGDPTIEDAKVTPMAKIVMDKANELAFTGRGNDNPQIQGTAWQAYQGITQYVDYAMPHRDNSQENRLALSWMGYGNEIKDRAWDYLLKIK